MAFSAQFGFVPVSSTALQSPQMLLSTKSNPAGPSSGCLDPSKAIIPGEGLPMGAAAIPYLTRMTGLPESVIAAQSALAAQGHGIEPSAFYSLAGAPQGFPLDRTQELWKSLHQQSPMMYPFDPMMAAHPYGAFYGGLDLNNAARRKNATRETTSALKAWLYEHRKNPYPTKGEKIMLAIITKMTLTQVSTWFANARRRLKKESKSGWSKDKDLDDNDSDVDIDDCVKGSGDEFDDDVKFRLGSTSSSMDQRDVSNDCGDDVTVTSDLSDISDCEENNVSKSKIPPLSSTPTDQSNILSSFHKAPEVPSPIYSPSKSLPGPVRQSSGPLGAVRSLSQNQMYIKPKIWSIADFVSSTERKHSDNSEIIGTSASTVQRHIHVPVLMHSGNSINGHRFHENKDENLTAKLVPSEKREEETALNLAITDKVKTTHTVVSPSNTTSMSMSTSTAPPSTQDSQR